MATLAIVPKYENLFPNKHHEVMMPQYHLLSPTFPMVALPRCDNPFVGLSLLSRLVPTLGWSTPRTDRVDVTLRFTSTTSVRMVR
jgi:hypothetical protein